MTTILPPFDITAVRKQARLHPESGAVTVGYSADRNRVLEMLSDSLATELVCMLRYRRHHFMAQGIQAAELSREFLEHSNEELRHADLLASRIVQLGGEPDFSPDFLLHRSHAEYVHVARLPDMVLENLVAERIAIDAYRYFIACLGTDDPTTRGLLESILAVEEQHADELASLHQSLASRGMSMRRQAIEVCET